ncbi:unnamed protein product [Heligmosomoides polygyrus]|uniref:Uncharacterized protein n=1 Tax=Heligmosomoides polygyrus TaxID=6339 RepID=A0A183GWG6_HELPZ|nr:unnamed protein product [Heligmosomoides polygyrus]
MDVARDEIRDAFMYMMTSAHPLFSAAFVVLLFAGMLFQLSMFICIEHNGALNTQILSNIRAAVQVLLYSVDILKCIQSRCSRWQTIRQNEN